MQQYEDLLAYCAKRRVRVQDIDASLDESLDAGLLALTPSTNLQELEAKLEELSSRQPFLSRPSSDRDPSEQETAYNNACRLHDELEDLVSKFLSWYWYLKIHKEWHKFFYITTNIHVQDVQKGFWLNLRVGQVYAIRITSHKHGLHSLFPTNTPKHFMIFTPEREGEVTEGTN